MTLLMANKPRITRAGVFLGSTYIGCWLWCCDGQGIHSAGATPHEAWWYWEDAKTNETGEQWYPHPVPTPEELRAKQV